MYFNQNSLQTFKENSQLKPFNLKKAQKKIHPKTNNFPSVHKLILFGFILMMNRKVLQFNPTAILQKLFGLHKFIGQFNKFPTFFGIYYISFTVFPRIIYCLSNKCSNCFSTINFIMEKFSRSVLCFKIC
jgi:hypothetical protein